ncbi:cytochrome P450 [Dietzia natronolimnaea]|uniref:Cytochrome P450 n=1 Tax=Dietzia natronolimnaea TaxID=161920 RepID=A0A2A2WLX8_9ACTN|nr:cytochrome P450 [Dietzia natronolimnaea]PAY22181.1 cytochrome P450 [Dietzia natronolimnaea]
MDSTTDRTAPAASEASLTGDDPAPLLPPGPALPRSIQGVGFGIARRRVLQRLQARYGNAVTVHLPIYGRAVVISDPALAKALFTAPQESLTNVDPNLGRVLGEQSMFALEGTDHRRRRKLLTPPLHGRRIKGYEAVVEEKTRRELDSWVVDRPFASMPSMTRITLDIIIRTVFGARDDELVTLRRVIPPMVEAGSAVVITPELPARVGTVGVGTVGAGSLGPRGRFARYKKVYDDAINALIDRGRRDDRLDERDDILAMMLQSTYDDGSSMTDEEIRDELTALLVAGHETTATTLAWALERLSRNPAVLDELVAEVDAGGTDYRHATILEVQRSRPVIDLVGRHVQAPHLDLGPWRIPRGYNVLVAISLLHDDSAHFAQPERFDPTRFLDTTPPPAWLPFGGGTRRCIGAAFATMEMDVVLRTLLSMYEIIPTAERDEKWHSRGVAFAPHRGGRITVRRR